MDIQPKWRFAISQSLFEGHILHAFPFADMIIFAQTGIIFHDKYRYAVPMRLQSVVVVTGTMDVSVVKYTKPANNFIRNICNVAMSTFAWLNVLPVRDNELIF